MADILKAATTASALRRGRNCRSSLEGSASLRANLRSGVRRLSVRLPAWAQCASSGGGDRSNTESRQDEGYFDSMPHDKLMKCVRMRVVDGAVLGLIKQWLEAPVVEEIQDDGNRGRKPRYKVTRNTIPIATRKRRFLGSRIYSCYRHCKCCF
jgi:hypothetical protein